MFSQIISRLTITRMWKNRHVYLPYVASVIGTMALFFSLNNLLHYESLATAAGGEILSMMLYLGIGIIVIFSAIFLLYTASFLMKTQRKELALYGILGMERSHLVFIVFLENIIVYIIGVILGALVGWLLSYVLFLGFSKMFGLDELSNSVFSWKTCVTMAIIFGVIFIGNMLVNIKSIYQIQLSSMLRESEAGEKKIRFMTIKGLIGLACIAYGYYLSFTITSAIESILFFFVAVFFVIIGTFLFFGSSITMILGWMKKNKTIYYNKRNFIVISNMLSRMRKNAAGLATITILSTMLLVALSTTVSWFASIDALTAETELYDVTLASIKSSEENKSNMELIIQQVEEAAQKYDVTLTNAHMYTSERIAVPIQANHFFENTDDALVAYPSISTIEQFNHIAGTKLTLNDNEIYIWGKNTELTDYVVPLQIGDTVYQIKDGFTEQMQEAYRKLPSVATGASKIEIFVSSPEQQAIMQEQLKNAFPNAYDDYYVAERFEYVADFAGNPTAIKQLNHYLLNEGEDVFLKNGDIVLASTVKGEMKQNVIQVLGMILFVGVLLSVLFLLATGLVIYYKQLTEGIEDGKQYQIMQKIGMSHKEIKQVGNKQILTFFFVPLLVAACHTFAAIPILSVLSKGILNVPVELMIRVNIIITLAFVCVYILIYLMTSKAYYKAIEYSK